MTASALAMTMTACSLLPGASGPDPVVERFVTALSQGDAAAAAAVTDDPPAAARTIIGAFEGLGRPRLTTTVQDVADGRFSYRAGWDLGEGRSWSYLAHGLVQPDGNGWQVHWTPSVLHDALQPGDALKLRSMPPAAARVLDQDGSSLVRTQTVTVVRVDPAGTTDLDQTVAAIAPVLARIDPDVTAASLRRDIQAGTREPVTVITLREDDAARVEPALRAVPGVVLVPQARRLAERRVTSPALAGLTKDQPDGSAAGWQVAAVDAGGATRSRLAGQDPAPAPDVVLTLDLDVQVAAQDAVSNVEQPAALVALRPSTGGILAVAQNRAADAEGPIALTGLYPPGSTFKVVTATAALESGAVTPDTPLPCPGTENIQGRQIPNDGEFDLGTVAFHTAFAHSCNTTFARLGTALDPTALARTAARLGLGTDWSVPGVTTLTGNVPDSATAAEQVEASIGQGRVVASPFGMALVAATVVAGRIPSPTLIEGRPGTPTAAAERQPVSDGLRADLAAMMRETVTGGSATQLADLPGVAGKTGTAQYGDGTTSQRWFIATRGDLAIAVLVVGGGSSRPAVAAAGDFLRATPSP